MKKLIILVGILLLINCSSCKQTPKKRTVIVELTETNNNLPVKDSISYLNYQEFEIDGIIYYWVYQKGYPKDGKIVCPTRDNAIINQEYLY